MLASKETWWNAWFGASRRRTFQEVVQTQSRSQRYLPGPQVDTSVWKTLRCATGLSCRLLFATYRWRSMAVSTLALLVERDLESLRYYSQLLDLSSHQRAV